MKKALIIYQSKTGTTKKYGFAIRDFLNEQGIEAKAIPVMNYDEEELKQADYVFLGCWTSGLFVIFQHPDKQWSDFAEKLPDIPDKKIALFTTYKLLTGSMFRKMQQKLDGKVKEIVFTLKSKNTSLSEHDKQRIMEMLN